MEFGHFFKLDSFSKLDKGKVSFRYLAVRIKKLSPGEADVIYPVYLEMGRNSINFYYHQGNYQDNGSTTRESHRNVRILHLPLSINLNIKDTLSAILSSGVYQTYYEIGSEYEVLYDDDYIAYWNLEVFNPGDYKKNLDSSKRKLSFRKLLLDFLFDLEHSQVFYNNPIIEEVEIRLKENFLFNALAAKASYYWLREQYQKNRFNKKLALHYGRELAAAEQQWIDIMQDARAVSVFSNASDWFIPDVEVELERVLFPKDGFNRNRWRKLLEKDDAKNFTSENIRLLRRSAQYFSRRYNIFDALRTIWLSKPNRFLFFLIVGIPASIYFAWDLSSPMRSVSTFESCILFVFAAFLVFLVLMFLFFYDMVFTLLGIIMPRLIMAISSAWLFFVITEEFWETSLDINVSEHLSVLFLLVPVVLFVGLEIRNIAPDISVHWLIGRMTGILLISFIYSLVIGTLFINFAGKRLLIKSGYLDVFFERLVQSESVTIKDGRWLEAAAKLYISKSENISVDSLGTTMQQVMTSSAWNEFNKLSEHDRRKILDLYLNHLKMQTHLESKDFFLTAIKEKNSNQKQLYNYLSNVVFKSSGMPIMQELTFQLPLLGKYSLVIFPSLLLYRAIYTIFIGIFIQLIFEEKPITEPL